MFVLLAFLLAAGPVPLIPRDVLFGNPERALPQLSPDGKSVAWVAPDAKNVLQVWVRGGSAEPKQMTHDPKRGVRTYYWAHDGKTLLYLQDNDGDENFHVYGVDLPSGNVRDYTGFQGVRASVEELNPDFPDTVLLTMNVRDRTQFDVWRLTLSTGALVLDTENPGDAQGFLIDAQLQVRGAVATLEDASTELRVRDAPGQPWRPFLKAGVEENLGWVSFSRDGKSAVLVSSIGRDTAALVSRDLASGAEQVLSSSNEVDAEEQLVAIQPRTHVVQAAGFMPGRLKWTVLDPSVKADFEGIARLFPGGDFAVVSRDDADAHWVARFTTDRGSVRYYVWDRAARRGLMLFEAQPKLSQAQLAPMEPVEFKARDGLLLHGYLTLPAVAKAKGLPLVLLVHGGPWARDRWGFDSYAQFLANRGYAVLQVNYRGSTGYGKKHLNAGDKQWGLKMHTDLLDGMDWAVKKGYADPKKVAVYGGSYGGYAALASLTFTPETFACAVDIVGPSNLHTLLKSIPPYWKTFKRVFNVRLGNAEDPKDGPLLDAASPLFKADKIVRPLLIGQGANDPRVKQAESEQIVSAIEKAGGKVTYVLYTDEGHGFRRPENSTDFTARSEAFLGGCLGGRVEPMQAGKIPGSTAIVRVIGK